MLGPKSENTRIPLILSYAVPYKVIKSGRLVGVQHNYICQGVFYCMLMVSRVRPCGVTISSSSKKDNSKNTGVDVILYAESDFDWKLTSILFESACNMIT